MANVFSFEKGSNCQNHSSSFHLLIKKSDPPPLAKLLIPPTHYGEIPLYLYPLALFGKPCKGFVVCFMLQVTEV